MAGYNKTTDAGLSVQFQTFFEPKLLERIKLMLVLEQFAFKNPLPKNAGAKTVRMFRFTEPSVADIQTLAEGVIPASSTHKQLLLEYIEATLAAYGQTITITDVLDSTSLFSMAEQANIQNAEDAALHCDRLSMYELTKTSGAIGASDNYSNRGALYANGGANYAAIYNTGTKAATKIMTATDILDGATLLKVRKAPRVNGSYVYVVPPQVSRDIMAGSNSNTLWADVSKYSAAVQIFNGELGKIYGVRVVETTEAYRSAATEPTTNPVAQVSASGVVFTTHMLGRGAFGVVDLSVLGSPNSPKVILVTGADKSDPLNQIASMISWKTFWAVQVVQPRWMVQIVTQSGSNA